MKTYKCIIIDDEPQVITWLTSYIAQMPGLVLQKAYQDPLEAMTELSVGEPVDLILLDIQMPRLSGLDLAHQIRKKTDKLVFTTSYKKFAFDAFEAEANAYLLKPYSFSKFATTINKLLAADQVVAADPGVDDFFLAKSKNDNLKLIKISILDIVAVESQQNYVMIHTLNGNVVTHLSLTEMSNILKQYRGFEQYQRSFIVAKRHIEQIYGNTLVMVNGLRITVGDFYRKEFTAFLAQKMLKSRG